MRSLLVTVAGPGGRRDLSLPADAPVTELLPVLVRLVGDGAAVDGWTLTPTGGRPLPAGSSLVAGGILNGALLHLAPPHPVRAAPPPPPPPPPRDGCTPAGRTAEALPPRHQLPERATLAAQALLASPESQPPANTTRRPKGGLASALQAVATAAARHRGAAPPGAAACAPSPAPPPDPAGAHIQTGGADGGRGAAAGREALSRLRRARGAWRSSSYMELLDAAVEEARLGRPVTVAVAAAQDGAGATTVTGLLGTLLASHRRDRVLAVDAGGSDHPGSLARTLGIGWEHGTRETGERGAGDPAGAAGDLLARLARAMPAEAGAERRPAWLADDLVARLARAMPARAELDARLGRAAHGLAVLPAPARRAPLDERAWRLALERLRSLFPLVLVDCGAGLAEPAGRAAVRTCDQLLLVTDADPASASLAVEAGLPLIRAGIAVTLVVNRMPAEGGRGGSLHGPAAAREPRAGVDLDRLGGYLPDAHGLVTVPSAPRAAAELAAGTFTWPSAAAGWRRALHELAASLVADWPRLGPRSADEQENSPFG